jgi:spermidine synthase
MRLVLGTIGLTSVIGQVMLIREFVCVFYGNELSLGLTLATWLLWVAVGSWLAGHLTPRFDLGRRSYLLSLVLIALLLPAEIALVRDLRNILGVTPGLMIGFGTMVWAAFVILAPLCLLLGFQFSLGAHLLRHRGGTVGQAYVLEGIGAAVGGLLFSLLLVRVSTPFQIALGLGALNIGAGFWILEPLSDAESPKNSLVPWRALCLAVALPLFCVSLPLGGRLDQRTWRWSWSDALFIEDSIYGRITVTGRDSQRAFFQNNLLMFETQGTFPEEVAHLPLLQHPQPENVLLIGGGASGTLREILKHPVRRVEYVELDPLLIRAAENQLPPEESAVFEDPRVSINYLDGRLYVARTDQQFDVVILDLPEPSTGQLNRFYTEEFFQQVGDILAEGGIFSLGLPSAENYLSPELRYRNGSVYHTLLSVFGSVLVLPGDYNFFLASQEPLSTDYSLLAQRLAQRGISTRWVNEAYLQYLFTTDRFARTTSSLADIEPVRLNRDLWPICYFYDMVLWLSKFYTNLRGLFYAASLLSLWWLTIPLLTLLVIVWRFRGVSVPAVVALTGFSGMAVEVIILLAFQALKGYVYQEVALITAAFMAGAASGAAAMNVMQAKLLQRSRLRPRYLFVLLQAAITLFALSLALVLGASVAWPLPDSLFPLLAAVAGLLVGMEFPLAVYMTKGAASKVAGLIYGADLTGACFGAFLSSVFLIPLLGIPQTCYAVSMLALTGLVLLLL